MIYLLVALTALLLFFFLFVFEPFSPVPYFPSNKKDLPQILKALNIRKNQTVIDLGAGDGIVIFEAASHAFSKNLNTTFIAVEINPLLVLVLYLRRYAHPNKRKIQIVWGDMFKKELPQLSGLTTYFIYISPWHIQQLVKKISTKRKGTELISYFYPASKGGRLRLKEVFQGKNTVYKYIYV